MSARKAADYCGVSEKTIRNWLTAGRLPGVKRGRAYLIPVEALEEYRRLGRRDGIGHDARQRQGAPPDTLALQIDTACQAVATVVATVLKRALGGPL
jgi:excisionase family DNA binding protein